MHLPDFAEDFAADALAARLATRHHTARGGEDVDSESTLDAADLVAADVNAAARTRNARQITNGGFVVGPVLEINAQYRVPVFLSGLVVRDVALFLEDAGNLRL